MRLPPLDSLRFFEATARCLSVRVAAEELHVTPGAVSQQVRKLETFLGRSLFDRLPRGLALTATGTDYFKLCQEALLLIAHATNKTTATARIILVSCTPGFAAQWLLPRLQEFMRLAPNVDVHVSTTDRVVDLKADEAHFAIRHGHGSYRGLHSEVLVDDDLVPVCSPRVIAPRRVAQMHDIERGPLLHDEHRGDWRLWLQGAGMDPLLAERGVVLVDSNAVIENAIAGNGIALVRKPLVQRELAAKRLLAVKAPGLRTSTAYHLVYRRQTLADADLRAFRDWVMAKARD